MDIIDKSGLIRVTGFNNVVDKFYDKFVCDCVYYIANGDIKPANKNFSTIKNNFEIILTNDTITDICTDNNFETKEINVEFTKFSEIKHLQPNSIFNTIGVIYELRGLQEIQSKNSSKIYLKRDIIIIDTMKQYQLHFGMLMQKILTTII